jgi:hypothetical protein
MSTEVRFCRECRAATPHVVLNGRDVAAHLCQRCLLQWTSQHETQEKAKGRRIFNREGEAKMETRSVEVKSKTKIVCYEVCCQACNLSQIYHGKSHTRCIHCLFPLDLRKLKPKYQ